MIAGGESHRVSIVRVRNATREDLSQVHTLMVAFANEIGFEFSLTSEDLVTAVNADRSRIRIAVGVIDEHVVGYAIVCVVDALWTTRRRAVLDDLFVAPPHRGKGVGGALLQFLIGMHEADGLELVTVTPVSVPVHPVFQPYLDRAVICRRLTFTSQNP